MSDIQASLAVHAPRRRLKAGSIEAGIGMAIILGWLLLALGASLVAPYDPNGLDLAAVLAAPGEAHWSGTNNLGRDVLSRVLHGARIDIWMGFVGVGIPLVIGVGVGLISGYFGGLTDTVLIEKLMRAAQAGASIDLIVRGVCCLRPGVPGLTENIRVISIVDRFLEHSRIYYFESGGKQDLYVSSADWMNRNFQRRVEVMFPVEDPKLRARIVDEILSVSLGDNQRARVLRRDGTYERMLPGPSDVPLRSQARFIELAKAQSTVPLLDRGLAIRPTMRLGSRSSESSERPALPKTPTKSLLAIPVSPAKSDESSSIK